MTAASAHSPPTPDQLWGLLPPPVRKKISLCPNGLWCQSAAPLNPAWCSGTRGGSAAGGSTARAGARRGVRGGDGVRAVVPPADGGGGPAAQDQREPRPRTDGN